MNEIEKLEQGIAALERQRSILGDAVVDAALDPLRARLEELKIQETAPPFGERGGDLPANQRRKQVTVLFADVPGFTALSESMDAEDVTALINDLWLHLDAIIMQHGGQIDKHIGDAVMALWGADVTHEDDAERAVRAALAMQSEIGRAAVTAEEAKPHTRLLPEAPGAVKLRIGIHTGSVMLSSVGTRGEQTAIGDTVNLASRLEHLAPVGGILISRDTFRLVRGVFDVEVMEPVQVRGRSEPVRVYRVQQARPRAFRLGTRGVEGVETRMIGRERELQQVQAQLLQVVQRGKLCMFTIVGEAGVGKSRLLHEFQAWFDLLPDELWVFKGRASGEMMRLPYALLRDFFAFRFEIADSDPLELARQKLVKGVIDFMGAQDAEAEMKAHFLGHLLGLDFSASPHLSGILEDARQIRNRAFHYLVQFFAAVTLEVPAMLVIEDLHWADDGSLDALEHLVQSCSNLPLFVLANARLTLFERRAAWGENWPGHTRLDLHLLSDQDTHLLVQEILQRVRSIPPRLSEVILENADGNPFYVEEMIKMLIDEQVIIPGEEVWQVQPGLLDEVHVPATLTGVLQARLDSLPLQEHKALQRASIIGRIFWDQAVQNLNLAGDEDAPAGEAKRLAGDGLTRRLLDRLSQRELIFRRDESAFAGATEYTFKHTLLREVAYETVLKRQRRVYHAQAAAWLIERSGERVEEYAGLIAEHFERAGEGDQAAAWYGRAAAQAVQSFALETALEYYQKALDLAPLGYPGRTALLGGLGNALWMRARYDEAYRVFEKMRLEAEHSRDLLGQAHALNNLSRTLERLNQPREAAETARQAQELAAQAGAAGCQQLALAVYQEGWALYRLGELEAAIRAGERALGLADDLGDPGRRERALSSKLLGAAYQILGQFERAVTLEREALRLYQELDDQVGMATILNNSGVTAHWRGDYATAVDHYLRALQIAQAIGDRDGEIIYYNNLGGARVGLGEYAAAEEMLRHAVALVGKQNHAVLAETYRFLAEACLGQEKLVQAVEASRQAIGLAQNAGSQEMAAAAWRALGNCSVRAMFRRNTGPLASDRPGTMPHPRLCFSESLRIFHEIGMEPDQARTLRDWALYERQVGNLIDAAPMWSEARQIFTRLGMQAEVERMDQAG